MCWKRERDESKLGGTYRERNPDEHREYLRNHNLLKKYKITQAEWDRLFAAQGHRCACCNATSPGTKHGWATDHDHATGAVRGILCRRCNITLGMFGDDVDRIRQTVDMFFRYLTRNPSEQYAERVAA